MENKDYLLAVSISIKVPAFSMPALPKVDISPAKSWAKKKGEQLKHLGSVVVDLIVDHNVNNVVNADK